MCFDEPQKRLITGMYGSNFLFFVANALVAMMVVYEGCCLRFGHVRCM